MTTEALRKIIMVRNWIIVPDGISISYERTDEYPYKLLHLILSSEETAHALLSMACIDGYLLENGTLIIEYEGVNYTWGNFSIIYRTCQWEALTIAIRHEAEKELKNDMNMLELDSALEALR